MSNQLAEAARQYLIATAHLGACPGTRDVLDAAIAAHEDSLREKAAKPAEPVAWRYKYKFHDIGETGAYEYHSHDFACVARLPKGEPLYAAPVAVALQWMPIESAPKDGEVLIYVTETDEQFVAYWDDGWRFSRNAKLKSPTHWMPLPPAPEMKP